ncbi:MAG: TIGR00159 family protein [Bacteroidetes bacterium CG2_30_32_10]|nr:MAG: TIGR00159 family protein [Bacteroidetes bacterium CG2_30_32_10]
MLQLFVTTFMTVRFLDVIDVLLVAILLYEVYKLIKGTAAINIFLGVIALYLLWKLVRYYEMELLSEILNRFVSVGIIVLIIVFQQEIRQFLLLVGKPAFIKRGFFRWKWAINQEILTDITPIVKACENMSKTNTGALIVLAKTNELKYYIETGEVIDANISDRLIENIFFKNSPLHDGAVIIIGNKIKSAKCILPVSESHNIPAHLGLRHRAGFGITEQSDALSIIVSEQTGSISLCKNGEIKKDLKPLQLKEILEEEFKI